MGGKLLATSEAGYLVTNRDDAYWNAVISCQHAGGTEHAGGRSEDGFPSDLRPYYDSLHLTYRLSVLNAILLVHQLAKLDEENANRIQNRAWFVEALDGVGSVSRPRLPGRRSRLPHRLAELRGRARRHLQADISRGATG